MSAFHRFRSVIAGEPQAGMVYMYHAIVNKLTITWIRAMGARPEPKGVSFTFLFASKLQKIFIAR